MVIPWNLRLGIELEIRHEKVRGFVFAFVFGLFEIISFNPKHQKCFQKGRNGWRDLETHNSKRALREETL